MTRIQFTIVFNCCNSIDLFFVRSGTIKKHPLIGWAKEVMIDGGALGSLMSGSGPTVFGIFQDEDLLKTCKNTLEKKGITIACKTI